VEAVEGLVAIAKDVTAPHAARVSAWNAVLDRGLGKPQAKTDATVTRRYVVRMPEKAESAEEWQAKHSPTATIQ
jgi:hypothetical protein